MYIQIIKFDSWVPYENIVIYCDAIRDKYEIYLSCAHAIRVICHVCLSVYNRFRQRRLLGFFHFVF